MELDDVVSFSQLFSLLDAEDEAIDNDLRLFDK